MAAPEALSPQASSFACGPRRPPRPAMFYSDRSRNVWSMDASRVVPVRGIRPLLARYRHDHFHLPVRHADSKGAVLDTEASPGGLSRTGLPDDRGRLYRSRSGDLARAHLAGSRGHQVPDSETNVRWRGRV